VLTCRPDRTSITRQPPHTPGASCRWRAPRCRRTVGSAGSCAPREVGAGDHAKPGANLVGG
jgi:hypothetical protein